MTDEEFDQKKENLTHNQKQVAEAYAFATSKAEAARAVGLAPSTVYGYPDEVFEVGEEMLDRKMEATEEGYKSLDIAALKKLKAYFEGDIDLERVDLEAIQWVHNVNHGRPMQKQEVEHSGGIDLDEGDMEAAEQMVQNLNSDQ